MVVDGRLGGASLLGLRSVCMGGMEKGRQRGIPRFNNHSLSNIIKEHREKVYCRLKEAPMDEKELEFVDLGGKETEDERVGGTPGPPPPLGGAAQQQA